MSDTALYKTSAFVHCNQSIVIHDLTNVAFYGDDDDIGLIKRLAETPGTLSSILSLPGIEELRERVDFFIRERVIVPVSYDESGDFMAHRVDIETCRQCNARCKFCPQSVAPKSRAVMSMELFQLILSRLEGTKPEWVAFNHYGEPLLDPLFRARVSLLRERGFPLGLYTNATLLKESTIDFLAQGGVYKVVFNFPSLEPAEWSNLMQLPEKSYWRARRAIEYYLSSKAPVENGIYLSVNVPDETQEERAKRIEEHFSALGKVDVRMEFSNSRAGSVENEFVQISSRAESRHYAGCERIVQHLHVSWEGKVYLCCQDYDQSVVLGDLTKDSVASIMSSQIARDFRAELYGLTAMKTGRLCLDCNMLRRDRFSEVALPMRLTSP